jgi:hypothetical protein
MSGLITSSPSSRATSKAATDQSPQADPTVQTSIRTFESTRISVIAASQAHDIFGRPAGSGAAAHPIKVLTKFASALGPSNNHASPKQHVISAPHKLYFGPREKTCLAAQRLWNRDLAL